MKSPSYDEKNCLHDAMQKITDNHDSHRHYMALGNKLYKACGHTAFSRTQFVRAGDRRRGKYKWLHRKGTDHQMAMKITLYIDMRCETETGKPHTFSPNCCRTRKQSRDHKWSSCTKVSN